MGRTGASRPEPERWERTTPGKRSLDRASSEKTTKQLFRPAQPNALQMSCGRGLVRRGRRGLQRSYTSPPPSHKSAVAASSICLLGCAPGERGRQPPEPGGRPATRARGGASRCWSLRPLSPEPWRAGSCGMPCVFETPARASAERRARLPRWSSTRSAADRSAAEGAGPRTGGLDRRAGIRAGLEGATDAPRTGRHRERGNHQRSCCCFSGAT